MLAACENGEFRLARPVIQNAQTKYSENINLKIIPNPAQTILTISTSLEKYTATLINPIGVTLFKENIGFEKIIDVSSYPRGISFPTIESNGKIVGKRTIALQ